MSYVTAIENAAWFLALTGMTIETFDSFLPYFADCHDEYFRWHTVDNRKRSGLPPHTIQRNRKVSSTRLRVEHHISSAKILKVPREECRLRNNRIVDGLFHTGTAFYNL